MATVLQLAIAAGFKSITEGIDMALQALVKCIPPTEIIDCVHPDNPKLEITKVTYEDGMYIVHYENGDWLRMDMEKAKVIRNEL